MGSLRRSKTPLDFFFYSWQEPQCLNQFHIWSGLGEIVTWLLESKFSCPHSELSFPLLCSFELKTTFSLLWLIFLSPYCQIFGTSYFLMPESSLHCNAWDKLQKLFWSSIKKHNQLRKLVYQYRMYGVYEGFICGSGLIVGVLLGSSEFRIWLPFLRLTSFTCLLLSVEAVKESRTEGKRQRYLYTQILFWGSWCRMMWKCFYGTR